MTLGTVPCRVLSLRWIALLLALAGGIVVSSGPVHAVSDPLEPINRPLFVLNDKLDRYALRPIAKGYDAITPAPVQRSVGNFFANLYDITSALNAVLQWRWDGAVQSGGRVLVNSTLGIVGLFDVATDMGISPYRTDFGQTLAIWGVPEGPYLMLPIFGPRTFRTGTATLVDTFVLSVPTYLNDNTARNIIWGTELVHGRARLLDTDTLITGDRYIFVRDAYLQQRSILVNDGEIMDDFSDFEDPFEQGSFEQDPFEQEPLEEDPVEEASVEEDPFEKEF